MAYEARLGPSRPSQTRIRRTDQDAAAVLAAQHGVGGGGPYVVHLRDVELKLAALAAALVETGGADAALLLAQLVVQLEQVGGDGTGDDLTLLGHGGGLGVELLVGGVPAPGRVVGLRLDGGDAPGQFVDPFLGGLAALHDLQDDVLEVALALGEGDDLVLEVLQVLGGGHDAGVEALLVAGGALAHLVDVLLGLGLLARAVALLGLRGDQQVAELGEVLVQRLDLGVLGQRLPLVRELLQADVQGLDVEESDLVGGRGVQLGAPVESGGWGVGVDAAWAVQGSVTVLET